MTRDYREWLRREIDAARRAQLAPKPKRNLQIVQYGGWGPRRAAAGNRALAALREATQRHHDRRKKAA